MSSLLSRLTAAVGDAYRIEEELGGGGMSRVFLAEEVRLGRRVVIKVLPPEMAAGVNVERFEREIQLAARLQHPHIVPLLTAGADGDLLYYVMPYIEGESLREKIAREGELPVGEVGRILRGVLDALSYAHGQGVVHRDMKPDNVMLTGKHAVVTDFGVAKAVSASTGESSLTSLGVALGTPTYMAPEQAAADPNVDHRADIYAVGAMTYEMLCGRPPFQGPNPQTILSAHVTQAPEPVTSHRPAVPPMLSAAIMRCLEKHAADRWQTADELLGQVEALVTPTGGTTPTGTQPVISAATEQAIRRAHPARVAALFGVGAALLLAVVYLLMVQIGLPGWVFPGAVLLLALGLPVMVLTGQRERARLQARTSGVVIPTPTGLHRLLTWRRGLIGGGVAFGGLALFVAGFMAMRSLGIGPVGTLVASGVLEARAPIILADFDDRTGDSTLAAALTEAFRVDLSQSEVVTLMPTGALNAALGRMLRDPSAPLDAPTAREVAVREGVGAVLGGEINRAGSGYLLSAQLVEPETGNVLAAFRESAGSDADVIPAIEALSRSFLERIGDSYRTIRSRTPLNQVTTSSLPALQRYTQGIRAEKQGDLQRALQLFREAIELDSTFAMAYRKVSVVLSNTFGSQAEDVAHATRAYELRDRLPELERYQTTVYYFTTVEFDYDRAMSVIRSAMEAYPDDPTLLNMAAYLHAWTYRYEEALPFARRARAYGSSAFSNQITAELGLGRFAAAEFTVAEFDSLYTGHPFTRFYAASVAAGRKDFPEIVGLVQPVASGGEALMPISAAANWFLSVAEEARGHPGAARDAVREAQRLEMYRAELGNALAASIQLATLSARYGGTFDEAREIVDEALRRVPLDSIHAFDRPYTTLAEFLAQIGDTERAAQLMTEYVREVPEGLRRANPHRLEARAAIAEQRYDDAIAALRERVAAPDPTVCYACGAYKLGRAYDLAGRLDSAVAVWERTLDRPDGFPFSDAFWLPLALQRLGEIYEERGNNETAIDYYTRLVDLWAEADEELQPIVRDVRGRIERLVRER